MVKRIKITIDKIAYGGSGIGRYQDMVVFVPFSAPGDELSVTIIEEKKSYWLGEIDTIITPSSFRVQPPCPYFMVCGGCQLQHLGYEFQLSIKKSLVEDALNRLAKLTPVVREPLGMAEPWRYRNKTQFPLGFGKDVQIGYYRRGTHRVINIESCLVHPPEFDRLSEFLRTSIKRAREFIYREKDHTGNLRHIIIRKGFGTGECLLIAVTKTGQLRAGVYNDIRDEYPEIIGVVQNVNPEKTNRILGSRYKTLAGRAFYQEKLLNKKFQVSAGSFFQVNTQQTETALKTILEFMNPSGSEEIVDLFAGVGTIGITVSPLVKRVIGIEIDPNAINDGRENLKLNGVRNMELVAGAAETAISRLNRCDVLLLDPPRRGCTEALLKEIARLAPKKIVYVSCNPTTLARDLSILATSGFQTVAIQPIDLFPHTYHIETIACIEKIDLTTKHTKITKQKFL